MKEIKIEKEINLSKKDLLDYFDKAIKSQRKRFPLVLHNKGAKKNKLVNFLIKNTYIRPHSHNSEEKNEKIQILYGHVNLIIFNEKGEVTDFKELKFSKKKKQIVTIPAFTIHSYLVVSDKAIIYEKMNGKYDENWQTYPNWAPIENSKKSLFFIKYIQNLNQNS